MMVLVDYAWTVFTILRFHAHDPHSTDLELRTTRIIPYITHTYIYIYIYVYK